MLNFKNLGLLGTTANLHKARNRANFLQSPQILQFADFNRVYFSTRFLDKALKPISKIEFLNFDKSFQLIEDESKSLELEPSVLGAYDEHGIFPFSPFRKSETEIFGYISGWSRRVSVDVETAIGYSVSKDNGATFQRCGRGPIMAAARGEPFLVGDPFVIYDGEKYRMFYIFGTEWLKNPVDPHAPLERIYKIGMASSDDGIGWVRSNGMQLISSNQELECQALPSVVKYGDYWLMAFCHRNAFNFRSNPKDGYRLAFAKSLDCISWQRMSENEFSFELANWNSNMQCYPNIFSAGGEIYILSNGNNFGRDGFGLHKLHEVAI